MSRSAVRLRPRYGRIAACVAAAATTLVSLVGIEVADDPEEAAGGPTGAVVLSSGSSTSPTGSPTGAAAAAPAAGGPPLRTAPSSRTSDAVEDGLPEGSGTGRRVVFSESQQRVWLVGAEEEVARTYLVSGSTEDNLDPGTYEVYSRSRTATGVDGSDLRYMVRFTHGDNAAIGFHSIPRMDGRRMQTRAELGTPLSHGCVRQALPDAQALWRFAPVGTVVVVTP